VSHAAAIAAFVLGMTAAEPATACPDCPSVTQARSQIRADGIAFNALVLLLPFVFVAGLCVVIETQRSSSG
jgi:hypothetical protein